MRGGRDSLQGPCGGGAWGPEGAWGRGARAPLRHELAGAEGKAERLGEGGGLLRALSVRVFAWGG